MPDHPLSDFTLPAGTVIEGRYRILDRIGQGGFAMVYKAEHASLGKEVALKVLDLTGNAHDVNMFRTRFQREAQLASKLEHPNVVRIYDFGFVEQNQQPYMAMELLHGYDLEEELLRHGPLEPERAMRLFEGALAGLAEAHAKGIVHKDLKPSNLFLTHPGTPHERMVVLDFGIARQHDDPEGRLTKTNQYTGTPAYAAPEYINGQHASPALDVYQMGLIIGESLSGTPVVEASTPMAYLIAHCNGLQRLDERLHDSPIANVLQRAVSVDPASRQPDARALRDELLAVPIESIPDLSGVGYVSTRARPAPRSHDSIAHHATLDSVPPEASALSPYHATGPAALPTEVTQKSAFPILIALGLVVTIFLLLPVVGGVAYLVLDDSQEQVKHMAQSPTETGSTIVPSQYDQPLIKINDEALQALDRAKAQEIDPNHWQQHYRRFEHAHQAYHFMLNVMEYSLPLYLLFWDQGSKNLDQVESYVPAGFDPLYESAYAQVVAALNSPGENEALDSTLRAWRTQVEKVQSVHLELVDYWVDDKLWKQDRGAVARDLNKRLITQLERHTTLKQDLFEVVTAQERRILGERIEALHPTRDVVEIDILRTFLAIQDLHHELLADPHSPQSESALGKAKSAYKVARRSARRAEKPGQQVYLPDDQTHIDEIRNYLHEVEAYQTQLAEHADNPHFMSKFFLAHGHATTISSAYHRMLTNYYRLTLKRPTLEAIQKLYPNKKQ